MDNIKFNSNSNSTTTTTTMKTMKPNPSTRSYRDVNVNIDVRNQEDIDIRVVSNGVTIELIVNNVSLDKVYPNGNINVLSGVLGDNAITASLVYTPEALYCACTALNVKSMKLASEDRWVEPTS